MNGGVWPRSRFRVRASLVVAVPLALVLALPMTTCTLARTQTAAQLTSCADSDAVSAAVSVNGSLDPSFIGLAVPSQARSAGSDLPDISISIMVYSDGAWSLGVSDAGSVPEGALAGNGTMSVSVELGQPSATAGPTSAEGNQLVFRVVSGY